MFHLSQMGQVPMHKSRSAILQGNQNIYCFKSDPSSVFFTLKVKQANGIEIFFLNIEV